MKLRKLSELYSFSTQEIQRLTTELYESLHDDAGNPISSAEEVSELVKDFRMRVNIEVATVKDACLEYNHS
jgi:hypothetical protein